MLCYYIASEGSFVKVTDFDLDDCVAFLTNKASKRLAEVLEKRLLEYDVTRAQWISMYYIESNENITQKMLADKMGIRESTLARLIDRCEKDDLIIRTSNHEDKRVKVLQLTEKGKHLNKVLTQVAEQFKDDAIEGISQDELKIYKRILDQMVKNVEI